MEAVTLTSPNKSASTLARTQYVRPAEFRALAVSHRRMVRADDAHAQVRGLRDLETGELFLVDERALRSCSR